MSFSTESAGGDASLYAFVLQVLRGPVPDEDHPYIRDDVICLAVNRLARRDARWLREQLDNTDHPAATRDYLRAEISPPLAPGTGVHPPCPGVCGPDRTRPPGRSE